MTPRSEMAVPADRFVLTRPASRASAADAAYAHQRADQRYDRRRGARVCPTSCQLDTTVDTPIGPSVRSRTVGFSAVRPEATIAAPRPPSHVSTPASSGDPSTFWLSVAQRPTRDDHLGAMADRRLCSRPGRSTRLVDRRQPLRDHLLQALALPVRCETVPAEGRHPRTTSTWSMREGGTPQRRRAALVVRPCSTTGRTVSRRCKFFRCRPNWQLGFLTPLPVLTSSLDLEVGRRQRPLGCVDTWAAPGGVRLVPTGGGDMSEQPVMSQEP